MSALSRGIDTKNTTLVIRRMDWDLGVMVDPQPVEYRDPYT